ncbi:MAG: CBS domain-containing protein [Spirochaetes bacterium]|nr:CBS domain-containing protein [Spirochaetota bacterium]MBU0954077.1 CBS domain-containing protein [Spirochaetota bacterium]
MDIPINTEGGSRVILELIYSLKVRDVMTRKLVTASADTGMREVQQLMRDNGITGIPIVERTRLLGIVSIGDLLKALDQGQMAEPAASHMSASVVTLEEEMPLTFAISYLNRYEFRRFPVLDKTGSLAGIITASDIIKTLLVEMNREVERLEATIAHPQTIDPAASPGLDPGSAGTPEEIVLSLSFPTRQYDFDGAGKASAEFKKALKQLGIEASIVRRAAIASYELELNQVIHSTGGVMEYILRGGRITIVARDQGPGIADVQAALTEGFSTANNWIRSLGFGAGLGLPNAKRSGDDFSIDSAPGRGTTVCVTLNYAAGP